MYRCTCTTRYTQEVSTQKSVVLVILSLALWFEIEGVSKKYVDTCTVLVLGSWGRSGDNVTSGPEFCSGGASEWGIRTSRLRLAREPSGLRALDQTFFPTSFLNMSPPRPGLESKPQKFPHETVCQSVLTLDGGVEILFLALPIQISKCTKSPESTELTWSWIAEFLSILDHHVEAAI